MRLNQLVMSQAGNNFKYLRKLRGWTQQQLALKLKIKRSLVGAYEEGRAEPRLDVLEKVCSIFRLTLDELLLTDLGASKSGSKYFEKRRAMKLAGPPVAEIRFVPVKAAAGYLAGYADPEFVDELNTFTLPMLAPGSYRAFEIIGDSMLPTPSGSVIVGEKIDNIDDIKANNTYVVVSKNEGIVYKSVIKNTRSKNKVTLVSDNPQYEPYSLSTEDILELWKAQMIITKANIQQRWDVNQLAGLVNNLQEQVSTLKRKIS